MNKNLNKYNKKFNRIIRTIELIGIAIILLAVLISIVYFAINRTKSDEENQNSDTSLDDTIDEEIEGNNTTVTIEESEEVLLNPGKGFVLRDSTNSNYDDVVSVGYYRFEWSDIEPEEGVYNWDVIDSKLENYVSRGKKFAFGVKCASSSSSSEYVTPKWVFDDGAEYYTYTTSSGVEQKIPVWTDEIFLEKVNNFIKALAARYDGNENISYIDIRSYGNYGEQHLNTIGGTDITSEQLKELYIKPYIEAFKNTLLVCPWGKTMYNDTYEWAVENGVTIRVDSILKYTNEHRCLMAYGKYPTIYEYNYTYNSLKKLGLWDEEALIESIKKGKPSYIEFYPGMYDDDPEFCKYVANHIGYYFRFTGAEFKNTVATDEADEITLSFRNEGVAPLYEDCTTYIALLDEDYNLVSKYKTDIDAQSWMPEADDEENAENIETVSITFDDVEPGNYIIAVGLFLNENDETPTYLLANTNKTDDKWYIFGNIEITESENDKIKSISNDIISSYTEFLNSYSSELSLQSMTDVKSYITTLNETVEKLENYSQENIEELIKVHYEIGNKIVLSYVESGQISESSLEKMLNDIDSIGVLYEEIAIIKTNNIDNTNFETTNAELTAYRGEYYGDLDISYIEELNQKAQNYYNNATTVQNDFGTRLTENYRSYYLAQWANDLLEKKINDYLDSNPVEVQYNVNTITNQNVIATVVAGNDATLSTNISNNAYTFNENGSIEIGYTRRDLSGTVTATVTWIDKTAPTITGVQNDKLYLDSVTPIISDNNALASVIIYKNGQEVTNYQANSTITEDGNYKLVATDEAGNQTILEFYISRTPATIQYSASTTEYTNQNIIATLTSEFDFEITNYDKESYTFEANGEFTFEFEIKGTALTLTASVGNIDKTAPTITGVEKNKQYMSSVTPVIADEHLSTYTLYLNSAEVEGFTSGTEVSEEGFYKLVAKDLAGNETTIEFTIMEVLSEDYKLQDSYILNVAGSTTTTEFISNVGISSGKVIRDNKTLSSTDIVATGDTLKTDAGEEYTVIVSGDVNCDGEVNLKDVTKLRIYIVKRNNLNENEKLAADCNLDGKSISVKDLVRLRLMVLANQ